MSNGGFQVGPLGVERLFQIFIAIHRDGDGTERLAEIMSIYDDTE